jgi:hypothetical protein
MAKTTVRVRECHNLLFDNRTDEYGNLRDRTFEIVEGALRLRRDGICILGERGGFAHTCPINNVTFGGGYVANRAMSDQVLRINGPTGESFRFRYISRIHNWDRLSLFETNSSVSTDAVQLFREEIADYGPVVGSAIASVRVASITAWWTIAMLVCHAAIGLLFYGTGRAVHLLYGHLGTEAEASMRMLLWLGEAVVFGIWDLSLLAYVDRSPFFRVILPLGLLVSVLAFGCWWFESWDSVLTTIQAFFHPRTLFETPLR